MTATYGRIFPIGYTATGANGQVVANASVRVTLAGTNTLVALKRDAAGNTPATNPTIAPDLSDIAGRYPQLWADVAVPVDIEFTYPAPFTGQEPPKQLSVSPNTGEGLPAPSPPPPPVVIDPLILRVSGMTEGAAGQQIRFRATSALSPFNLIPSSGITVEQKTGANTWRYMFYHHQNWDLDALPNIFPGPAIGDESMTVWNSARFVIQTNNHQFSDRILGAVTQVNNGAITAATITQSVGGWPANSTVPLIANDVANQNNQTAVIVANTDGSGNPTSITITNGGSNYSAAGNILLLSAPRPNANKLDVAPTLDLGRQWVPGPGSLLSAVNFQGMSQAGIVDTQYGQIAIVVNQAGDLPNNVESLSQMFFATAGPYNINAGVRIEASFGRGMQILGPNNGLPPGGGVTQGWLNAFGGLKGRQLVIGEATSIPNGNYSEICPRDNATVGTTCLYVGGNRAGTLQPLINLCVNNAGYNTAVASLWVPFNNSNNRSINAGGTINASGADYAEYERRAPGVASFRAGDVVGFDENGELTDRFDDAVRFMLKSTNPNLVGGDFHFDMDVPQLTLPPEPEYLDTTVDSAAWMRRLGPAPAAPPDDASEVDQLRYRVAYSEWEDGRRKLLDLLDQAQKSAADAPETNARLKAEWEAACDVARAEHAAAMQAYNAAWDAAREPYDRIAYCGKTPVRNPPSDARAGDFLFAAPTQDRAIRLIAVRDYQEAAGLDPRLKVGLVHSAKDGVVIAAIGTGH